MYQKMLLGMFAGGAASVVGNPADLALVRMQADSVMPPAQRRGYRGITDAVVRIVREEGVAALWRGSAPTVLRAVFLNMALLATSDQIKEMLAPVLGGKSSLSNLFVSSMAGGVAAALASLPFDMVKTRLQRMAPGPDGRMPYAGVLDCMRKIAAREGLAALYTVRSSSFCFVMLSTCAFATTITTTCQPAAGLVAYLRAAHRPVRLCHAGGVGPHHHQPAVGAQGGGGGGRRHGMTARPPVCVSSLQYHRVWHCSALAVWLSVRYRVVVGEVEVGGCGRRRSTRCAPPPCVSFAWWRLRTAAAAS